MSDPKPDPEESKAPAKPPAKPPATAPAKAPTAEAPTAAAPEPFTEVTVDTVLATEIGEFGRCHAQTLLVVMGLVLFTGVANASYIFTTAKIETRCFIPECESRPATYKPPWMKNVIPEKNNQHDLCYRYAPKPGAPAKAEKKGTCPREMFDWKKKIPCSEYVLANHYSVVYDFKLECKEWERTFMGTVRKLGTMTALPITSYISDRWGRRIALIFNAVNTAIIGTLRSWVKSYPGFLVLDFIEGTLGSGLYSGAYVLMVEIFGAKWRVAAGASVSTSYSIGQVVLGICAWLCPYWRPLTRLLYIPQFISILAYWAIMDSVRWYMAKAKYEEAEALLKKMAKVNGRIIHESTLANMRRTTIEARERAVNDAARIGAGTSLVSQVLVHKRVLLRVLVSPIWWITTTFIYHGLALNSTGVYGNPYQNFILVSLIEIPGFWIAYSLLNKVGRKPVLSAGFWICSLCLFSYMVIPRNYQLYVYMVAKAAIAMVITSVYVYTSELYPTNNRHKLLALASMFGRVGSITAPLTPALATQFFTDLPFVLFGGMAMISGVLIFFTPETLGTTLPDNFEQAERLGKK